MDDSDREDLWPSRGGVSVPLRRLLPDVQYDLIVTFKKNSQIDRISLSILLTQTKEERRRQHTCGTHTLPIAVGSMVTWI